MDDLIYLRIAPDLRRSAQYVLAASVPLTALCFWSCRFGRNETLLAAAVPSAVMFLLCMTMLVPLRWALRIDRQGVSRRLFFWWGAPWTWADLSSGRIEKRYSYEFFDPARPRGRRRLSLEYLAATDISRTLELINTHYRLPPPPHVPQELEIKYGNFFCRVVRLDAQGLHLHGARESRAYLWNEVRRVHLIRMDPLRRDFRSLEIVLPDREIELRLNGTAPSWRGATAEVVNEFLLRHLPPSLIEADVFGGRPARRSDLEKQLAQARDQCRGPRRCILILMPLVVALLIWMAVTESILKTAVMTTICIFLMMPLYWIVPSELRSRCLKLEQELAGFDEVDNHLPQTRD